MSNGDYEFLRDYNEEERWVWLAAQLDGLRCRLNAADALQDAQDDDIARLRDGYAEVERRCAKRAWHGAALKTGVALLITTLLSSFGTLLFMVLNRLI